MQGYVTFDDIKNNFFNLDFDEICISDSIDSFKMKICSFIDSSKLCISRSLMSNNIDFVKDVVSYIVSNYRGSGSIIYLNNSLYTYDVVINLTKSNLVIYGGSRPASGNGWDGTYSALDAESKI